jgi:tryptophan-rich sensory protein
MRGDAVVLASGAPEGRVFNHQGQFKPRYSRRQELVAGAGFLLLCLGVGLSGVGVSALGVHGWYLSLRRPPLCPPLSLYPPVWTLLYLMAGVAAWEIWRAPGFRLLNRQALIAWGWQIGLKALWTPVFFGLHWLLGSAILGLVLLAVLGETIRRFAGLKRWAALLMLPYAAWVAFEVYLDFGFWWLNR